MPVKKTVLKKPAAVVPKKRPSAAPATSLNEKVSSWKKGLTKTEKEGEGEETEDDVFVEKVDAGEETRKRGKRMWKKGKKDKEFVF